MINYYGGTGYEIPATIGDPYDRYEEEEDKKELYRSRLKAIEFNIIKNKPLYKSSAIIRQIRFLYMLYFTYKDYLKLCNNAQELKRYDYDFYASVALEQAEYFEEKYNIDIQGEFKE